MEQLSLFTLPSSPPPQYCSVNECRDVTCNVSTRVSGFGIFLTEQYCPPPLKTIHDPCWDEITRVKVDDILHGTDLDSADSGQFLEKEFAPQHNPPFSDTKDTQQAVIPCDFVGAQVNSDTQKVAPQHDTHWVERYWVDRGGNKYWYYRYCWMTGRKISRLHIGGVSNAIALKKKQAVEIAIADGETPGEIRKMIKEWGNPQRTSETSAAHPKF